MVKPITDEMRRATTEAIARIKRADAPYRPCPCGVYERGVHNAAKPCKGVSA